MLVAVDTSSYLEKGSSMLLLEKTFEQKSFQWKSNMEESGHLFPQGKELGTTGTVLGEEMWQMLL